MRQWIGRAAVVLLGGCGGGAVPAPSPILAVLPDSAQVYDGAGSAPVSTAELFRRLTAADIVLLGEIHDNGSHHRVRGALIAASQRHPAAVFEQLAESGEQIAKPAPDESLEAWLDRHGFDRKGWGWPLHQPVIAAAVSHARSIWGTGVSREALRAVVRGGDSAIPAHLRSLMERAPLDPATQGAIDRELIEGHCGQLPEAMVPGMRTAQIVRDAAMAGALLAAAQDGPAWLIAGNGHVRRDLAVPRLLRVAAPERNLVVVGLLELTPAGELPDAATRAGYDLVIVTRRAARADPCAGLRTSGAGS